MCKSIIYTHHLTIIIFDVFLQQHYFSLYVLYRICIKDELKAACAIFVETVILFSSNIIISYFPIHTIDAND